MSKIKIAVDCDIPVRAAAVLESMYGENGFEFYHVSKLVPPASSDDFWADALKRFGGHVALSGDGQIAYRPHKALAFIDNGFISFFVASPWHHMGGPGKVAHLIFHWPFIEAKIREGQQGTCWRVPCDAKRAKGKIEHLRLRKTDLLALEIPKHVLEAARKAKAAKSA